MNIHELFCSKQQVHELIGHSSTVHEQFMKSIQEHFMNTYSWTVGKIFDERSMNSSWIYMNVHECTIKVHDWGIPKYWYAKVG
jgi:urate oxidase